MACLVYHLISVQQSAPAGSFDRFGSACGAHFREERAQVAVRNRVARLPIRQQLQGRSFQWCDGQHRVQCHVV
jgi:hypothetical protein